MIPGHGRHTPRLILIAIALFLLFDTVVLGLNVWLSWRIEQQALGINLAGRQRMLSQRMVKALLQLEDAAALGTPPTTMLDELRQTFTLFDDTLSGFAQGHRTLDGGGRSIVLPAVDGMRARALVSEALALWQPWRARVAAVLEAPGEPLGERLALAADTARQRNLTLLELMNELTSELEHATQREAASIRRYQGIAFALALVDFFWAVWLYHRRLHLADRNHSLLEEIIERIAVAVLVIDDKDRVVRANRQAGTVFGSPPEELVGHAVSALLADGQGEERHGQRRDGSAFPAWVRQSAIAVDGRPMALLTLLDISERKAAESQLRIAATAFEAQEGISITDAAANIISVNRALTEITGYTADELLGENPRLLGSGRHGPAFFTSMWQTIRQSGAWQGEIWNRRKNGEFYPAWLTVTAVRDETGAVTNYVGTFIDIGERKSAEDEIRQLAYYDHLTQLANRRLMYDRLLQAMAGSARSGRHSALLLLDLDNFKSLNDLLGHAVGDQLLIEAAARLRACVRECDTVARLGGDEFVVILAELGDSLQAAPRAEAIAQKIQTALGRPYRLSLSGAGAPRQHYCTSSIGLVLFRDQSLGVDELLKRADAAMYQAKAAGRNTLRFFDPQLQHQVETRAEMENELRRAVVEQAFVLHYQPQVASDGEVIGAEALIRWPHPTRGLLLPAEFVPLAEESGLILPIGHWVLHTACSQLAAWAMRPATAELTLAVNVSARQIASPNFVSEVLALLAATGAPAKRLKLELTESLLLRNTDEIVARMRELRAHGVAFALDDFGTGYSSLAYLKHLPLDQVKIDQTFVRDMLEDSHDAAIARTVVALGNNLGLTVIAEGVETAAQRDLLIASGCLAYQGYFFEPPLAIADFESFLAGRA